MTFGVVSVSKASKMGLLSPTHHEERTSTPVTYLLPPSPLLMLYDVLRKIDGRALGNLISGNMEVLGR